MELIELVSVGTYIRPDGMTFPMNADGSKTIYECEGVHVCDIEPDEDWMTTLSDADRAIVEKILMEVK
jgi:hypothetical protein|tara:strand:- start:64 stop:267 length:204 start_codon:yes stop_codon:yes gene_type:complete